MKVQYHITPDQIQGAVGVLQHAEEGEPPRFSPSALLLYADVKIYGDTDPDVRIDFTDIPFVLLLREVRDFLKSDKTTELISGCYGEYMVQLTMPRSTSMLKIGGISRINVKPPSTGVLTKLVEAYMRGYERHVPQLTYFSRRWDLETEYKFQLARQGTAASSRF